MPRPPVAKRPLRHFDDHTVAPCRAAARRARTARHLRATTSTIKRRRLNDFRQASVTGFTLMRRYLRIGHDMPMIRHDFILRQ